jgi:hypothetical protein
MLGARSAFLVTPNGVLISTTRASALEPYAYHKNLREKLPHARTVVDFEGLLPFNPANQS